MLYRFRSTYVVAEKVVAGLSSEQNLVEDLLIFEKEMWCEEMSTRLRS
jgi:hypothetical protein